MRVEVTSASLAWTHAFGDEGRIDATDISGDLSPKASARLGDEIHFTTSKLSLTSRAGVVGPWRVDVEQDPNAPRRRASPSTRPCPTAPTRSSPV